jgi:ABC-type phosphate transport system substrate-binding protein
LFSIALLCSRIFRLTCEKRIDDTISLNKAVYLINHFSVFSMFKKSDILPLILALVSTALIVGTGFAWLAKNQIAGFKEEEFKQGNRILKTSDAQANTVANPLAPIKTNESKNTKNNFVVPVIVPQGTSVTINGSNKLEQINISLRKGFHEEYPGTVITTAADGIAVGLDLLRSRDIDLLALDRPLNQAEQEAGLVAIQINNSSIDEHQANAPLYYVYRNPINPDIEAFLGYALSEKGKEAIRHH